MSRATEQMVKDHLKKLSKETQLPFNQLLDTLFLERFLVRVGRSKFKDNLVFKGGMCLGQYLDLGRETRDIDFLILKLDISKEKVLDVFNEISLIDTGDEFVFDKAQIDSLSLEHKKYPGYRVQILGHLGKMQVPIQIDVGVGDVVRPKVLELELIHEKKPLFNDSINLNAYPPEYIFSEKLEAILYLRDINGRMKDFYDCWRIINDKKINISGFKKAIEDTFANRGTEFEFVNEDVTELQVRWNSFTRKNLFKDLDLLVVVKDINSFLREIGFS